MLRCSLAEFMGFLFFYLYRNSGLCRIMEEHRHLQPHPTNCVHFILETPNFSHYLFSSFSFAGLAMGYQRQSVNNNHNNAESKPTHSPPSHYPHGHKWNEPYFDLTMPRNITSLVGKSAYLGCRVKHLGNKTVSPRGWCPQNTTLEEKR